MAFLSVTTKKQSTKADVYSTNESHFTQLYKRIY